MTKTKNGDRLVVCWKTQQTVNREPNGTITNALTAQRVFRVSPLIDRKDMHFKQATLRTILQRVKTIHSTLSMQEYH